MKYTIKDLKNGDICIDCTPDDSLTKLNILLRLFEQPEEKIIDESFYIKCPRHSGGGINRGNVIFTNQLSLRPIKLSDLVISDEEALMTLTKGDKVLVSDNPTDFSEDFVETFLSMDNDFFYITEDAEHTISRWKYVKMIF